MRRLPGLRRIRILAPAIAVAVFISLLIVSPALAAPNVSGPVQGDRLPVSSLPDQWTSPANSARATTPTGPEVPSLDWVPCRDGFECAKASAPLDYGRPFGSAITLSLIRLPAADPVHRIGSLFMNPGGPGGSGVDFVRAVGKFLPLELRGRFDLIGFDPRGVGRSTPLRCFASFDEALAVLPPFAFPMTAAEEDLWRAGDQTLAAACADKGGAIQDHMSTANVARDMDLLRAAVGDARLNYLGLSYGSYLGVTYANLFPDRVGALVVDGVLDPVAWSTGTGDESTTLPFSTRLGSDAGSSSTLGEFFRLCDAAGTDCAFGPDARARYDALAQRLLIKPIEIVDEFGTFRFTYADLVGISIGALYAPFVWPDFAGLLANLEAAASSPDLRQTLTQLTNTLGLQTPAEQDYPNFVEAFPGVACGETDNPARYQAWPAAADTADQQNRYFGRPWTWPSSICQPWPGQDPDRYTGPWTAATANPVLVVGNSFDPATPYQGAQKVAELLPNSTLLTYAGWGHTAFMSGNFCVDSNVVAYLINLQVPADGTVCQPDGSPFGPLAAARAAQTAAASIQTALIPDIVRRAITHTKS